MRYEEMLLTIEKDEARRHISNRISDVRATITDDNIEYRTNAGLQLAILSDAALPSGGKGSKLRYRTAIISSHLIHARTKAHQIRRAVEKYKVD